MRGRLRTARGPAGDGRGRAAERPVGPRRGGTTSRRERAGWTCRRPTGWPASPGWPAHLAGGPSPAAARGGQRRRQRVVPQLRPDPAHQRPLLLQRHPVRDRRGAAGAGPLQRRLHQRRPRAGQRGDQRRPGDPGQAQARPVAAAQPQPGHRAPRRPGELARAGGRRPRGRAARASGRPGRRRRPGPRRRPGRGGRVAAHRRVRAAAAGARRGPAVGQLLRRRRRTPARPGRRRVEPRQPADRRGPPGVHGHHPAAAPHRVRRPAGHGPGGADERHDPAAGRARGVLARARGADHGGAVGAGALRAVLPRGGGLHRRRGEELGQGRPRAAGQRGGVGEQRRRRLHRQDRDADHRPPLGRGGPAGRPGRGRGRGAPGRLPGPQRLRRQPDLLGTGRGAPRRAVGGARGGPVLVVAAVERAAHRRRGRRAGRAGRAGPGPVRRTPHRRGDRADRAGAAGPGRRARRRSGCATAPGGRGCRRWSPSPWWRSPTSCGRTCTRPSPD
ncbi:hypothetical protein SAMN05660642_00760 [Geodermatophilus siccatus]|uniref:Uncharacterized protein n=1 Tax=Geodermatophilus siccatus TaxID=1137991 RepID=A0A1G9MSD2_9ACTN|nr:hypothetical protein SAMN05660642_00760 [Geodermatophilus siccatus]